MSFREPAESNDSGSGNTTGSQNVVIEEGESQDVNEGC